jgi:hypothetical protein
VRPRRPAYITFQAAAGRIIESYCRREIDRSVAVDELTEAGRTIFA